MFARCPPTVVPGRVRQPPYCSFHIVGKPAISGGAAPAMVMPILRRRKPSPADRFTLPIATAHARRVARPLPDTRAPSARPAQTRYAAVIYNDEDAPAQRIRPAHHAKRTARCAAPCPVAERCLPRVPPTPPRALIDGAERHARWFAVVENVDTLICFLLISRSSHPSMFKSLSFADSFRDSWRFAPYAIIRPR